jgi:hypothetical protein
MSSRTDGKPTNCACCANSYPGQLRREYQTYLKRIEAIAARQIAMLQQASPAEINALYQELSTRSGSSLPGQLEAEHTALITAFVCQAVARAVEIGVARVIPKDSGGKLLQKSLEGFPIQLALLQLAGIDCLKIHRQQVSRKRHSLIGAVINCKLKARALIRQEYARHYRSCAFQEAAAGSQTA